MADQQTPDYILSALTTALRTDPVAHARVIHFLALSEEHGCAEPYVRSLKNVCNDKPGAFGRVAERLAEDVRRVDRDPQYRQFMHNVWNNFLGDDLSEHPVDCEVVPAFPKCVLFTVTLYNLMRSIDRIPPESYEALQHISQTFKGAGPFAYGSRVLAVAKSAQPIGRLALIFIYLLSIYILNVLRWWKGEKTEKRCVKIFLDNGLSVAAGVLGGIFGERSGMLSANMAEGGTLGVEPLTMAILTVGGAFLGGSAAVILANALCDVCTQWLFGLPKTEVVENAYRFLGVSQTASNSDLNSRFRSLASQYRLNGNEPDPETLTELECSLAIIREERRKIQ